MAKQGNDWKAYDGRELKDGEVLVPQMVTQEYARSIGADMSALRTWTTAGIRYTVMFVPVPEEQEEICRKIFCQELNEYLDEKIGPARRGRCCTSLDELAEKGYDPADRRASTEAIVMEEILLDELIAELEKLNPLYRDMIRMGYSGLERKEIIGTLPLKKSQAYDLFRKCREEAEKFLKNQD